MMRSEYCTVLGHEIHYTTWGERRDDDDGWVVVCCHGLLRTCRDFDVIGEKLSAAGYFVICPDMIGRGLSQWSDRPQEDYLVPRYAAIVAGLLDTLNVRRVKWIGTSMGGIIGYFAAADPQGRDSITHLVLNDIGPTVNQEALTRIQSYGTVPTRELTFVALEERMKKNYAAFGITDPQQMRALVEHSLRRLPDGAWSTHYDIRVMQALMVGNGSGVPDVDTWAVFAQSTCPVLVLRGECSDLLSPETVAKMESVRPRTTSVVIPNVGHAPALMDNDQIRIVMQFLSHHAHSP